METRNDDQARHSLHYVRNVNPGGGHSNMGGNVHYSHSAASVIVQNAAVIGTPLASMNTVTGNH